MIAQRADLWVFSGATVALPAMLRILRSHYKVRTVVCEGGPRLFHALLEIEAIDILHLTWTPLIFGGAQAPTLTGFPGPFLRSTIRGRLKKIQAEAGECFLTYAL